jgi:hypothetical protein
LISRIPFLFPISNIFLSALLLPLWHKPFDFPIPPLRLAVNWAAILIKKGRFIKDKIKIIVGP